MIVGLALTFVTLFGEETLYDRDNLDIQPPNPTGYLNFRFQMLTGIWREMQRPHDCMENYPRLVLPSYTSLFLVSLW
jgi:hypothetical protein